MAEILLSLTIIGVVAAITLPSLTGNINERTWNTQRKALYARMSQAISLMPALNGYGTLIEGNDSTSAVDTAAETFVTAGLSKVMKINNICDYTHLTNCGIPGSVQTLGSNSILLSTLENTASFNTTVVGNASHQLKQNTKAAAFETANGESIIIYYNPNCISNRDENVEPWYLYHAICANFVYDLNGTRGPNTVGKDIGFITVFYPTDSMVVTAMPYARHETSTKNFETARKECMAKDSNSRLPNVNELAGMAFNRALLGMETGTYWSSSAIENQRWDVQFSTGSAYKGVPAGLNLFRCIMR